VLGAEKEPRAAARPSKAGDPKEMLAIYGKQRANRWKVAGTTVRERADKLRRLRDGILARRKEIQEAIHADFRKHPAEVDVTEIYPAIAEINHMIRHLSKWMKPTRVGSPLPLFGTRGEIRYEAKGLVLILSPWNYPFQLLINPLAAAIAAGNCVMLKPSSKVPNTSRFLKNFIAQLFDESEVALFEGSSAVSDALLELKFDHVFFTGSPSVGKKIMASAAKHLTPVTLELGGKSPVIVDETADVARAAERIVWGKYINAGQTCVAPDYLLIHESAERGFIEAAKSVIESRYGKAEDERRGSADFCRMVSVDHGAGLRKVLDEAVRAGARVEIGGGSDEKERYFAPTLLSGVTGASPIMKEEIFGPILPIVRYRTLDEAIRFVQEREKPLAFYVFSRKRASVERMIRESTAGGTCVNSLIIHLANPDLPFGGVGQSGMGSYHGRHGFLTFSHERSVLRQGWLDTVRLFYPPYTAGVRRMVDWVIRFLT